MIDWIIANGTSIIVTVVLVLVVGSIIFKMIKDRKSGKSSCGCGCGCGCHSENSCDKDKTDKK